MSAGPRWLPGIHQPTCVLGVLDGMWHSKKVMEQPFSRPLTPITIHSDVSKLFL